MRVFGYATTVSGALMKVFGAVFTDKPCAYCVLCWTSREQCYNVSCFANDRNIEDDGFIFLAANDLDRDIEDDDFVSPNCQQ